MLHYGIPFMTPMHNYGIPFMTPMHNYGIPFMHNYGIPFMGIPYITTGMRILPIGIGVKQFVIYIYTIIGEHSKKV